MNKFGSYPRGDPDPWANMSDGEREEWNKYLKPLDMSDNQSVWDNVPKDNSESRYLKLEDGDSVTLKFTNLYKQEQSEDTPDLYKSDDGQEWVFEFEDKEGNEKKVTCNSPQRAFFIGMREAGEPEPGAILNIKRTGEKQSTRYHVEEVDSFDEVAAPPKEEKKEKDIPF